MSLSRRPRERRATVGARAASALLVAVAFAPARAQETIRVSVDTFGIEANGQSGTLGNSSIAADGRAVAFECEATNLVANDTNGAADVFVHDRSTGVTERVSVDSAGVEADQMSLSPSLSADARCVAFASFATNLVTNDANGTWDVFVRDRTTGATERVSVDSFGAEGTDRSYSPVISADGRFVAFTSFAANLVPGDTNAHADVFVHDRTSGATERVSVDSAGAEGDGNSAFFDLPAISADGRFVAFSSNATNLVAGDTNRFDDIFVHDRATGVTERVSVRTSGSQANDRCYWPALSGDGRSVAFSSAASNLVAHDGNGHTDVFVHDRATGATERVSVDSAGETGDDESSFASLSADGQLVAFSSDATNLVAGDTNGWSDVFLHDRSSGATERLSVDSSGAQAGGGSYFPALAADGLGVAFFGYAPDLVANDTNGLADEFTRDLCATAASWSNYGAGFPGTFGVPTLTARSNPSFGATVPLDLSNSCGSFTIGLVLVGLQRTSIHSSWGGDLLVVPTLTLVVGILPGGSTFAGDIPADRHLCGVAIDVQAVESDPGAAKGVSFTPGLELLIGR